MNLDLRIGRDAPVPETRLRLFFTEGLLIYPSCLLIVYEQKNRRSCTNSSGTIAIHCTKLAVHIFDRTGTFCKFAYTHI
jgi:hypothetical protein